MKINIAIIALLMGTLGLLAQQTEVEPNDGIINPNSFTAPVDIGASMTNNPNDKDFFRIDLPYCGAWSFNIINHNLVPCSLQLYLYGSQNTADLIVPFGSPFNFNTQIPPAVIINAGGTIYVQVDQISGTDLGAYTLEIFADTSDAFECNNSYPEAFPIPTDTAFSAKLWGYDVDGNPDADYYRVNTPRCGVLNVEITNLHLSSDLIVKIYDNSPTPQLVATDLAPSVHALLSNSIYYIVITDGSGPLNPYELFDHAFTVTVTFDTSDLHECNNTFDDAPLIPLNTSFDAKLWGENELYGKTPDGVNLSQDIDYYEVHPTRCGVLNVEITNLHLSSDLIVKIYDNSPTPQLVATDLSPSVHALLSNSIYYIVITDGSGPLNPYELFDHAFTVTVTFDTSDVHECNNTFDDAPLIPVNTSFDAKLWGINDLYGKTPDIINQSQDIDYYEVHPTQCGVLNVQITNPHPDAELIIRVYDNSIPQPKLVASSLPRGPVHALLSSSVYYIVITDESGPLNYYELFDHAYTVTVTFDTSDVYECNNTFDDAPEIPLNIIFDAKLWGENRLFDASLSFDADYYRIEPGECGVLNITISEAHPSADLTISIYDNSIPTPQLVFGPATGSISALIADSTHYIVIKDGTGFGNYYEVFDDIFKVTVNFSPLAIITSNADTICAGESLNFTAANNQVNNWTWNFGTNVVPSTSTAQNPTDVIFNAPGQHLVTLSSNGCSTDTILVEVLPSTPDVNINGLTLTSSSPTGNQWYLDGNPIPNATGSTYTVTQNGVYSVCVSASSSCGSPCSDTLLITTVVGLENVLSGEDFEVYPNPANGHFTIKFPITTTQVQILNSIGQVVETRAINKQTNMQLELTEAGIYFIQIKNDNNIVTKKLAVSR